MKFKVLQKLRSPCYAHFFIPPESEITFPIAESWNGLIHVAEGEVRTAEETLPNGYLGIFGNGNRISLKNPSSTTLAEGILVFGEPIGEPIVQYGPFVMNTKEEIMKAFTDYQSGNFGN